MPPDNRIRPDGPCRHRARRPRHRIPTTGGFSPDSATAARGHAGRGAAHAPTSTARPAPQREALRVPHGVRLRRHRPPGLARARVREGPARTWARSSSSAWTPTRPTTPRSRRARSAAARCSSASRAPPSPGRIGLRRVDGTRSAASGGTLTIAPADARCPPASSTPRCRSRRSSSARASPPRSPTCSAADRPRASTSQLLRGSDGAVVTSWSEEAVEPGVPQTVEWDGTVARQGRPPGPLPLPR